MEGLSLSGLSGCLTWNGWFLAAHKSLLGDAPSRCKVPVPDTAAAAKSLQSCPTLCDPIDGSPPGFSVPGILQARMLEWVALP